MVGYPFTYGDELTPEESLKRLKQVGAGAALVITLYFLSTQAAHALDGVDGKPSSPSIPETAKAPTAPPGVKPGKAVVAPGSPTNEKATNLLSGLASSICASAVTTGDFWVGVVCGLIVVAGMRMIKPD
jgi:hypothetical protein